MEGVLSNFVRKWLMSRGSYVWRGFCPRVFCPEGVLSAHPKFKTKSAKEMRARLIQCVSNLG